jgi:hypothetical protein
MSACRDLIDSWHNGWLGSISGPDKDEKNDTWLDVKFSRPRDKVPIRAHFVSVRFKPQDDQPVSYLIECDKTEKKVSVPIVDVTLQMHLRIKAKGGTRAQDIGLLD